MSQIKTPNAEVINEAAELLKSGQLVGMPTETVYGLAGNALDGVAVARIYETKGRPNFNPLIVHVPDLTAAQKYGAFSNTALALATQFWPGPLTIVVKQVANNGISELVTAGLDTIAIRVPKHPVAQDLLKQSGLPVAAPSANASGKLSPTAAIHVAQSLGDKVPLILAGGGSEIGLESTVIDMSADKPILLRPGGITKEQLEGVLGVEIAEGFEETENPKSPGLLVKHYAPVTPLRLRATDVAPDEALLGFGSDKFMGVRGGGFARDLPPGRYQNLSPDGDLNEAASNLFKMLHYLDAAGAQSIAVMDIPNTGLGVAINDRLTRGTAK